MSKLLSFDCVVVGGGSAGAVLAARLSEDASRSVLLLEARPTFRPSEAPQSVRDASNLAPDPALLWDDNAARPPNAPFELRARVLGGGSSINAANFSRAFASHFARWTARGLTGWSYEDVLPYYKKMETDLHGDPALHGHSGPPGGDAGVAKLCQHCRRGMMRLVEVLSPARLAVWLLPPQPENSS